MDRQQYEAALMDRARHLYCVLMMDPLRVPLLEPKNKEHYPAQMRSPTQVEFWTELVYELQIIKPEIE